MSISIKIVEDGENIIANVELPKYGGARGKAPIDCRVNVDYVRSHLASLGYETTNGTGPSLRNRNGVLTGTYTFQKLTHTTPSIHRTAPVEEVTEVVEEVLQESIEVLKKVEKEVKNKPQSLTPSVRKEPKKEKINKSSKTMKRRTEN